MGQKFTVTYEATPNPQSMRFVVGAQIADETIQFDAPEKCARSPIAQKLFGFPWAQAIMIGPTFITVSKRSWVEWSVIADPLAALIEEHLEQDEAVLLPADTVMETADSATQDETGDTNQILATDSPAVRKIKEILLHVVRPAVQMDGGDITFQKYEEGRLYVKLRGSCSGCPSSTITLKDGIEVRMKEEIPELLEVIAI